MVHIDRTFGTFAAGFTLHLVLLTGCSTPAVEIVLDQPELSGSQRRMELAGDRAYWAHDDTCCRLLLECPLPGSRKGQPQFAVYVRLPASVGTHSVGTPFASEGIVSGFLLQRTGRMRGLSPFVMGEIVIEDVATARGTLHIKCADRTEIRGRFVGQPGSTLRRFEETHEADIIQAMQVAAYIDRQVGEGLLHAARK